MRAAVLIAGNFLRQQRWFVLFLVAYAVVVFGGLGVLAGGNNQNDLMELFWQQAGYAVFFSLFLAAYAIHNDRKSRRILSVLSKAVTRGQYVAGMMLGITGAIGIYYLAIGLCTAWLLRSATHVAQIFAMLGALGMACLLVSAVAIFFSTFLPPLFAMVASAAVIGLSALLRAWHIWADFLPVYTLILGVTGNAMRHLTWQVLGLAAADILLLWLLAGWVFGWRDIAVAIE